MCDRNSTETLHCSFCRKSQYEVRKLIAGLDVFICETCVGNCQQHLTDRDAAATVAQSCSFCGSSSEEVDRLIAGPAGCICDECARLCMVVIVAEEEP